MNRHDDWSAAALDVLAERRAALGARAPEAETIQAFYRGELPAEEAETVREFLVAFPEVAAAFASDDDDEPSAIGPGHPAHLSAAERNAGWQELATRLEIDWVPPRRRNSPWLLVWAIAASLSAVGFGTRLLSSHQNRSEPGVVRFETVDVDWVRSPSTRVETFHLDPLAKELLLRLELPSLDPLARFRVEVRALRGSTSPSLWHEENVVPEGDGTITIRLPHHLVPPGRYEIAIVADSPRTQWDLAFETTR